MRQQIFGLSNIAGSEKLALPVTRASFFFVSNIDPPVVGPPPATTVDVVVAVPMMTMPMKPTVAVMASVVAPITTASKNLSRESH